MNHSPDAKETLTRKIIYFFVSSFNPQVIEMLSTPNKPYAWRAECKVRSSYHSQNHERPPRDLEEAIPLVDVIRKIQLADNGMKGQLTHNRSTESMYSNCSIHHFVLYLRRGWFKFLVACYCIFKYFNNFDI